MTVGFDCRRCGRRHTSGEASCGERGVSGFFSRGADEAAGRLGVHFRDTDPRPIERANGRGLAALIPTRSPQAWTDARIREAFIDDGGQAEYYDPINGARDQRRIAGAIFDEWLAAHDAEVIRRASV